MIPATGVQPCGNALITGYDYRINLGPAYEISVLGACLELGTRRHTYSEGVQKSALASVCGAIFLALFVRGPVAPMLTTLLSLLVATTLIYRRRPPVLGTVRVPVPSKDSKPRRARWPVGTE
jgi:hypothetical protein